MPVAEDFFKVDPEKIERLVAKFPDRIHEEQLIPTEKQKVDIQKFLLYNGLWIVLTYGADLISMVLPWLGKGVGQLIKWKFNGQWEQKKIGL